MFRLSKTLLRLPLSPSLVLPFTPFSTRSDRLQKKVEIENAIDSTHRLDTIADQETEKDKIDLFLKERRKEIEEVVTEREIPIQAMVAAISLSLPVILGGPLLNVFCYSDILPDYLGMIYNGVVKYSSIHLAFMGGIHWGFGLSEHDCQLDSINSTSQVKKLIYMGLAPIVVAFGLTSSLLYTVPLAVGVKLTTITSLASLHFYFLLMDKYVVNKKIAPVWFLKLKIWIALFSALGILSINNVITNFEEKIKRNNPIAKALPTNVDLNKLHLV